MKYVIILLFIATITFAVDSIDKLEGSYIKKADQIESQKQAAQQEVDAKYNKASVRLAESYLKALKAVLKTETQKGNFDAAIKAKAKIVEIETLLNKQAPKVTKPKIIKPKVVKPRLDPIVGQWKWIDKHKVILSVDGTATSSEESIVTWETSGLNKYSVTWKKRNSTLIDYLLLSPDGTMLSGKNNRGIKIWAIRIPIHPHWEGAKGEAKKTLHLLTTSALLTVNKTESATGKWTLANDTVTIKWNNGKFTIFKIHENKMIDSNGDTWIPLIEKPIKLTDLYPSHWEALKSKDAVIQLIDSKNCRIVIKGKNGLGGTWSEENDFLTIRWKNGAIEIFKIHGSKITDNHGKVWFLQLKKGE